MSETKQPIIVRRVKKGGHGHHGGAWKVAFADFVTAMMAFFLLLWLLSATTEEQRAGISDYFVNPSAVTGSAGGTNVAIDLGGGMNAPPADTSNEVDFLREELDEDTIAKEAKAAELAQLEQLKEKIETAIEQDAKLNQFRDQLLIDIMNDGLRIQIVDEENRPMFDSGSATLKSYTREILASIVGMVNALPNKISVTGHTDQTPFANGDENYSNWELSADRANAARRTLQSSGLPEEKVGRVVGLGSSVLFDAANPFNPINRRISLIVMNKEAEQALHEEAGVTFDEPESALPPPLEEALDPSVTSAASVGGSHGPS